MEDYLKKYSFNQTKVEAVYSDLATKLKMDKTSLQKFFLKKSEANIIKILHQKNATNADIKDALSLRGYEIDTANDQNQNSQNVERSFYNQAANSASRSYFVAAGNFQQNANGLLGGTNGVSVCGNTCSGVGTGKLLSTVNADSLLSYSYTPGAGLYYSLSAVSGGAMVNYGSNVINIAALQGLQSSNINVGVIDIDKDGLDDLVISTVDSSFDNLPVVLLNNQNSPFSTGYVLGECSSGNGANKILVGSFFGTNQAGLWCQSNNGINLFYTVNNNGQSNLSLQLAETNWCATGVPLVIDFNGDKFDDILCINNNQQQLLLSIQGQVFQSATADGTGNVALFNVNDINSAKFLVGDFDGNGKDDLLYQDNQSNNYFYLSNGKSFFSYMHNNGGSQYLINIAGGAFCDFSSYYVTGNFNNDQNSDLWCAGNNADMVMLSKLESNIDLPRIYIDLNYRNFKLNLPDLSSYNTTFVSSSNFVNAKSQGAVSFEAPLSLDIKLLNSMNSFKDDLKISNNIIAGKVVYSSEFDQYSQLLNNNVLTGYEVEKQPAKKLEYDLLSAPAKLTTNIISQWDNVRVASKLNLSVSPNQCATAQLTAFLYKDVSIPYSAQGFATIRDEKGFLLSGQRLLDVAQNSFNKAVYLASNNEVGFDTVGTLIHNIVYNAESAILDCASPSSLQTATGLPKVIVSLSYRDFALSIPQAITQPVTQISSNAQIQNSKKYGSVEYTVPVSLEVKLAQKIDGFYADIKPNDLVKGGEVKYMKNFNDVQLSLNTDLSGYKISTAINKAYLQHSWFTPEAQISSELFSDWDKLDVTNQAKVSLVPAQCLNLKMTANLYENVQIFYTANGYFTAKDEYGYPVQGEQLLAIAQSIFNKDVTIDNTGEAVFSTSGTLTRNLVGGIATDISDC